MRDSRDERNDDADDRARQRLNERGNTHGGRGRRAEHDIADGSRDERGGAPGVEPDALISHPRIDDMTHDQHARKGQAESPRELTLNQPEKKKHRGGRTGGGRR